LAKETTPAQVRRTKVQLAEGDEGMKFVQVCAICGNAGWHFDGVVATICSCKSGDTLRAERSATAKPKLEFAPPPGKREIATTTLYVGANGQTFANEQAAKNSFDAAYLHSWLVAKCSDHHPGVGQVFGAIISNRREFIALLEGME
jgi:hypothetical protein